jgi:hypothetical protein
MVAEGYGEDCSGNFSLYRKGLMILKPINVICSTEAWHKGPVLFRQEIFYPSSKVVVGYNGELEWEESEGETKILNNNLNKKSRELDKLIYDCEFLNKTSKLFKVKYVGIKKVNNHDCYMIKISNNVNYVDEIKYIDTVNYYLRRTDYIDNTKEIQYYYYNFRQVGGIMFPFINEMKVVSDSIFVENIVLNMEINIPIADSLFDPPK